MVWSVVFAFLAAVSLFAAEQNPKVLPKQKRPKAPVEKPQLQRSHDSDDPFGSKEKPAKPSPKKPQRPAAKPMRPCENVAAIEAALASPTEMNFAETPLQDVIDALKERHQIEIMIDTKALGDVGIGTDSPVTLNVKGISLRSALNIMLRQLSLTWIIQDEVLMITTPEEADNLLTTKVYDVADLVVCRDEHGAVDDDYDSLIDIITSTVKPTTWDNVGGPGSIQGGTLGTAKVLVVTETREVHEGIVDLLAKIREIGKKTPNAGIPRHSNAAPKTTSAQMGPTVSGDPNPFAAQERGAAKKPADAGAPTPQKKSPKQPKHDAAKATKGDVGMF
jgi:hypothetical protein